MEHAYPTLRNPGRPILLLGFFLHPLPPSNTIAFYPGYQSLRCLIYLVERALSLCSGTGFICVGCRLSWWLWVGGWVGIPNKICIFVKDRQNKSGQNRSRHCQSLVGVVCWGAGWLGGNLVQVGWKWVLMYACPYKTNVRNLLDLLTGTSLLAQETSLSPFPWICTSIERDTKYFAEAFCKHVVSILITTGDKENINSIPFLLW